MTTSYRRCRALAVLLGAAALALAACSAPSSPASQGTSSPTVASLPTSTTLGSGSGHSGRNTATTAPKASNATALVDEWATCMRRHGDPDQTDPMIDSHGGINITVPSGDASHAFGEALHNVTGTCSQYLAAAQRVLRAEIPYTPFNPDTALIVQYANCIRANGIPNYPYPVGDKTDFNGTGINLNSPVFLSANNVCGKQIGAPAWWINGWGPPGDISSTSGPTGGVPHGDPVPVTG
ncbi:MAG: hypothetical protein ABSD97_03685 [Acidimicrobiales bacterium]